jgi:hypothetical protein
VAVPRRRRVCRLRPHFAPLSLLIFIEELFDAVVQRARTRNASVDVDGVVVFTVCHIVAGAAGGIVDS